MVDGTTLITSENIYTNEAIIVFLNKSKIYVNSDYLRYIGGYRTKRVVLNVDRTRKYLASSAFYLF